MTQRWMREPEAAAYLGCSASQFRKQHRQHLPSIPVGKSGIAWDRLDLDKYADDYRQRYGRPPQGGPSWQDEAAVSLKEARRGKSTNSPLGGDYEKVRLKVIGQQRS